MRPLRPLLLSSLLALTQACAGPGPAQEPTPAPASSGTRSGPGPGPLDAGAPQPPSDPELAALARIAQTVGTLADGGEADLNGNGHTDVYSARTFPSRSQAGLDL